MIFEWLLNNTLGVLVNFVTSLPAPNVGVTDVSGGLSWAMAFNSIAPLDAMVGGAVVLFGVSTTMFLVQITRYLLSFLPLVGGSGD